MGAEQSKQSTSVGSPDAPTATRAVQGDEMSATGPTHSRTSRSSVAAAQLLDDPEQRQQRAADDDSRQYASLKRSRADFENDDDDRGFQKRPVSPRRRRTGDTYRPRRSKSPSNTRHSFVPEGRDHYSPPPNDRPRSGPLSPDARYQWPLEDPRSPTSHWQSSRRRSTAGDSSPPGRSNLSSPTTRRAWLDGSTSASGHQVSDPLNSCHYKNMSWTNPNLKVKPQNGAALRQPNGDRSAHLPVKEATHLAEPNPATITYEGLENVPTGPKRMLSTTNAPSYPPDATLPAEVDPVVKRQPHIFIAAKHLPPRRSTIPHLRKSLRGYVPHDSDINIDQSGYFLRFENNEHGRKWLAACHNQYHRQLLFSEHTLHMVRRPYGLKTDEVLARPNVNGIKSAANPSFTTLQSPQTCKTPSLGMTAGDFGQKDSGGPCSGDPGASCHIVYARPPLHAALRRDKDDSSSISGATDLSASKLLTCFVCKTLPASEKLDSLIQCSTCPRRYHGRCLPDDIDQNRAWQCRRCVGKQVPMQTSAPIVGISPTQHLSPPSVGQKSRTNSEEYCPPEAEEGVQMKSIGECESNLHFQTTLSGEDLPNQPGLGSLSKAPETSTPDPAAVLSDETQQQAHDLVEQSFTMAHSAASATTAALKPKFNFIRKRTTQHATGKDDDAADAVSPTAAQHRVETDDEEMNNGGIINATSPKRKSHKWAGGGADKDIITAGATLLPKDRIRTSKGQYESATSTANHTGMSGTPTRQQAQTNQNLQEVFTSASPQQAYVPALSPDDQSGKNEIPQADEPNEQPRPAFAKRRGNRLAKCEGCDRVMGFDPTATTAYCSKCSGLNSVSSQHGATDMTGTVPDGDAPARNGNSPAYDSEHEVEHEKFTSHLDFWKTSALKSPSREQSPKLAVQRSPSTSLTPAPSTGPFDSAHESPVKSRKRESHTVAAKHDRDLGDSFSRPKGTYEKLIGMAMVAMKGTDITNKKITQWIVDNIPGYNLGEGEGWERGVSATVTMKQEGKTPPGAKAYWRTRGRKPGAKQNAEFTWELLPGAEHALLHWDPVLKEPRSPVKTGSVHTHSRVIKHVITNERRPEQDAAETSLHLTPVDSLAKINPDEDQARKHKRVTNVDRMAAAEESNGTVAAESAVDSMWKNRKPSPSGSASSEEEPLISRKRKKAAAASPEPSPPRTTDDMEVDVSPMQEAPVPKITLARAIKARVSTDHEEKVTGLHPNPGQIDLAALIKRESENIDFSATSLFDEWPEYSPINAFDREAKLEEIRKRPKRKQRFGLSGYHEDPWAQWKPKDVENRDNPAQSSFTSQRSNRAAKKTATTSDSLSLEPNVVEVDTIEELFGLPPKPLAIINADRQLLFRDGTTNEDGTLPRARKLFETGYA